VGRSVALGLVLGKTSRYVAYFVQYQQSKLIIDVPAAFSLELLLTGCTRYHLGCLSSRQRYSRRSRFRLRCCSPRQNDLSVTRHSQLETLRLTSTPRSISLRTLPSEILSGFISRSAFSPERGTRLFTFRQTYYKPCTRLDNVMQVKRHRCSYSRRLS
jgi:hypothetical protein